MGSPIVCVQIQDLKREAILWLARGATARIKQTPTRNEDRPIDWMLCEERHLADCFLEKSDF